MIYPKYYVHELQHSNDTCIRGTKTLFCQLKQGHEELQATSNLLVLVPLVLACVHL